MPKAAKKATKKQAVKKTTNENNSSKEPRRLTAPLRAVWRKVNTRRQKFLSRRPHRSFRLTRRRDYKRSLKIPGYWSFSIEVKNLLWKHKWLFGKYTLVYSSLSALIFGIMSQENFQLLNDTVISVNQDFLDGRVDGLMQNVAIFGGVLTGAFASQPTEPQQVYGGFLLILGWLSAIWLYRQLLAGHSKLKLRDGLYSSGAPLLGTLLVFVVILIQTLPLAVALVGYGAALAANIFDDALFTTLFWIAEVILITLSIYWLANSLLAMVIVTLPGMYPLAAFKAAGDLVTGRRLRILFRILWLGLSILTIWVVALIPLIALVNIVNFSWLPIVPLAVLLLGTVTLLWASAYTYLLYRKLVSDGSAPA